MTVCPISRTSDKHQVTENSRIITKIDENGILPEEINLGPKARSIILRQTDLGVSIYGEQEQKRRGSENPRI